MKVEDKNPVKTGEKGEKVETKGLVPDATVSPPAPNQPNPGQTASAPGSSDAPRNEPPQDNTARSSVHLTDDEAVALERMLDAEDEAEKQREAARPASAKQEEDTAQSKVAKLVALAPDDTPDEHIVWGIGANKLTMGDLRELVDGRKRS